MSRWAATKWARKGAVTEGEGVLGWGRRMGWEGGVRAGRAKEK
jgi:hypothetical protein